MSRLFVDRISPYQSGSVTVDGLNIDTGSLVTTASFNAYTSSNDSKVNSLIASTGSFATTGSNTFTQPQIINGTLTATQLTLTGGGGYDLIVTSSIKAGTIIDAGTNVRAGNTSGLYSALDNYAAYSWNQATQDGIGLAVDNAGYGSTGWAGPGIWGNDPSDNYPVLIGFQDKASWTDGRSTFLTPVKLNDVLEIAQQDPLPSGSVGQLSVSGSNLYYHNGSSWSQIN
jgi:hypothetical protein